MSLRARIVVGMLVACLLPTVPLVWGAARERATTARIVHDDVERRVVAETRRARAEQDITLRRALDAVCDDSLELDSITTDLAEGRWDARRAADASARLPAFARAHGFESIRILAADGAVLASSGPPGGRDARLRDAARAAGDRTFRRDEDPDRLYAACASGAVDAQGRVLVVADVEEARAAPTPPRDSDDVGGGSAANLADIAQGVIFCVIALAMGLWIGGDASRSLRTVQLAAARIGQGATDSSQGGKVRGEVGKTLAALDAMTADLQQAQRRALRAERVAAWRDIARRIAHEIKNPLLPIQMSIETMRKTYAKKHPDFDEIFEESTLTILEEVARLSRIVDEFSRFARMPRPRVETLDVRDVLAHVETLAPTGDVPLTVELRGELPRIRADREQLVQVLVNLAQNAADAARTKSPEKASVTVVAEPWEKGKGVVLSVRDNGPGIPASERQAVFEPYYTTKTGGTGLGLAIVHRIVVDHRGTVEIDEARDGSGGAEVRVTLPVEGPGEAADSSMTDGSLSQL